MPCWPRGRLIREEDKTTGGRDRHPREQNWIARSSPRRRGLETKPHREPLRSKLLECECRSPLLPCAGCARQRHVRAAAGSYCSTACDTRRQYRSRHSGCPSFDQQIVQKIELLHVIVLHVTGAMVTEKMVQLRNAIGQVLIADAIDHIDMFAGVQVIEAQTVGRSIRLRANVSSARGEHTQQ